MQKLLKTYFLPVFLLALVLGQQTFAALHAFSAEHDHVELSENPENDSKDCTSCTWIKNYSETHQWVNSIEQISFVSSWFIPVKESQYTSVVLADCTRSNHSNKAPPVV